jgi:hypothetical protein
VTRKINVKNIALILGVSIIDIGCGMYDRIFNNSGVIKLISDAIYSNINNAVITSTQWNSTNVNLATSVSGFNLYGLLIIVIVATGIMAILMSTMSFKGGMS